MLGLVELFNSVKKWGISCSETIQEFWHIMKKRLGPFVCMPFEDEIMKLCERICACNSDAEAIELTREMKSLLHDRILELRKSAVDPKMFESRHREA